MTTWIRTPPRGPLEQLTTLWHLEGAWDWESSATSASRTIWGRCKSNLGEVVDRREDDPDLGDRCPVCQGHWAKDDMLGAIERLKAAVEEGPDRDVERAQAIRRIRDQVVYAEARGVDVRRERAWLDDRGIR